MFGNVWFGHKGCLLRIPYVCACTCINMYTVTVHAWACTYMYMLPEVIVIASIRCYVVAQFHDFLRRGEASSYVVQYMSTVWMHCKTVSISSSCDVTAHMMLEQLHFCRLHAMGTVYLFIRTITLS